MTSKYDRDVDRFADEMKIRLSVHNDRDRYGLGSPSRLIKRLMEEVAELLAELPDCIDGDAFFRSDTSVAREAADVANFCMFLAIEAGVLRQGEDGPDFD